MRVLQWTAATVFLAAAGAFLVSELRTRREAAELHAPRVAPPSASVPRAPIRSAASNEPANESVNEPAAAPVAAPTQAAPTVRGPHVPDRRPVQTAIVDVPQHEPAYSRTVPEDLRPFFSPASQAEVLRPDYRTKSLHALDGPVPTAIAVSNLRPEDERVVAVLCDAHGHCTAVQGIRKTVGGRSSLRTEPLGTYDAPTEGGPYCVAVSADGRYAAVGGGFEAVHVWDVETGERKFVHDAPQSPVRHVFISEDAKWMIANTEDGVVYRFPLLGGLGNAIMPREEQPPFDLMTISPDGRAALGTHGDGHTKFHLFPPPGAQLDEKSAAKHFTAGHRAGAGYLGVAASNERLAIAMRRKPPGLLNGLFAEPETSVLLLPLPETEAFSPDSKTDAFMAKPVIDKPRLIGVNERRGWVVVAEHDAEHDAESQQRPSGGLWIHIQVIDQLTLRSIKTAGLHAMRNMEKPEHYRIAISPDGCAFLHVHQKDETGLGYLIDINTLPHYPLPKDVAFHHHVVEARDARQYDRLEELGDFLARDPHPFDWVSKNAPYVTLLGTLLATSTTDRQGRSSEDVLKQWIEDRPDSALPKLALAVHYEHLGWQARGSGFADQVDEEAWEVLEENLQKAEDVLADIEPNAQTPPAYFTIAIDVNKGLGGDPDRFEEIVDQLLKFAPEYLPAHCSAVEHLLPRWHGAPGSAEAYATYVAGHIADKSGDEAGDKAYALIAMRLACFAGVFEDERAGFQAFGFDEERIERGLEEWLAERPGDLHIIGGLLFTAWLREQPEDVLRYYDMYHNAYLRTPWNIWDKPVSRNAMRDWAKQQLSDARSVQE
jgi:hypothetical protein